MRSVQLHGVDRKGRCILTRRVRRDNLMKLVGDLEPCLIGIEACTGAFYWARQFEKCRHVMKIMAPQYVKPFVRRQKNDSNDAEAICTALQQPKMRFVPKKTLPSQPRSLCRSTRLTRTMPTVSRRLSDPVGRYRAVAVKSLLSCRIRALVTARAELVSIRTALSDVRRCSGARKGRNV
jgi:transposase